MLRARIADGRIAVNGSLFEDISRVNTDRSVANGLIEMLHGIAPLLSFEKILIRQMDARSPRLFMVQLAGEIEIDHILTEFIAPAGE